MGMMLKRHRRVAMAAPVPIKTAAPIVEAKTVAKKVEKIQHGANIGQYSIGTVR